MKQWAQTMLVALLVSVPLYLFWWVLACGFVWSDWNLEHQVEYFKVTWSFRGFINHAVTWWLSLIGYVVSLVLLLVLRRRLLKSRGPTEWQ